jgi:hypothetical protein
MNRLAHPAKQSGLNLTFHKHPADFFLTKKLPAQDLQDATSRVMLTTAHLENATNGTAHEVTQNYKAPGACFGWLRVVSWTAMLFFEMLKLALM